MSCVGVVTAAELECLVDCGCGRIESCWGAPGLVSWMVRKKTDWVAYEGLFFGLLVARRTRVLWLGSSGLCAEGLRLASRCGVVVMSCGC